MFTGIIEAVGAITNSKKESANLRLSIKSPFTSELKIDQSVSHNGVCLTIVEIRGEEYDVIAIDETLSKTNLGKLSAGDKINLERSMKLDDRLDGHLVQGHVDCVAVCKSIVEQNGSWLFQLAIGNWQLANDGLIVSKGSICINGVSLTVVEVNSETFSVAIIPYTFENTNFNSLKVGDEVNIEFDVFGKYVKAYLDKQNKS